MDNKITYTVKNNQTITVDFNQADVDRQVNQGLDDNAKNRGKGGGSSNSHGFPNKTK